MQQQGRGSPLLATARRLLLLKLSSGAASSEANNDRAEASRFQSVRDLVKSEFSELRVEENVEERWIVVSRYYYV